MKMITFPRIAVLVGSLLALAPVRGATPENMVLYWNGKMIDAVRLSRNPPPIAALHMATLHAAVHDTVSSITGTHRGWHNTERAPAGIDMDAAIASAAYTVLNVLWADSSNPRNVQVANEEALARIAEGPPKANGIAWGRKIAERILARRFASGHDKPVAGEYASRDPGKWRETPPGFRPAVLPHVARVTPFLLKAPEQFRAPPPPSPDSKQAADEAAEIVRIGARDGAERTEYETLSSPFWADDLGSCTPPGHWNLIAQDLARRRNLSVPETARLFALLNFATADAGIACWETKYYYRTWRPETAIRELDPRVNPHARPVPDFIPNMPSPAFPSYVSGHSSFSAAGSRVLERFFGTDEIEFTVTSDGLPGAVRSFKRLSDCRREVGMSRLWGGIHVRCDDVEGQKLGLRVADWVMDHALLPVAATPGS